MNERTNERANERTSKRASESANERKRTSERTNEIKLRKSELANTRIIYKKTLTDKQTDKTRIRKQRKELDYTINKTNRAYFNSLSSSVKLVATSLKFPSPRLLKADTIIS